MVVLFDRARSFGRDAHGAVREEGDTRLASQISRINPGDQWGDRCRNQIALTSHTSIPEATGLTPQEAGRLPCGPHAEGRQSHLYVNVESPSPLPVPAREGPGSSTAGTAHLLPHHTPSTPPLSLPLR
ncbi:unnamed protein product [Rangifer tarandus platyrhynchus]|uniref:Uncharacterized protein n=2 Tax=Rangifer tarandus platyrhynchus TaxID=3082113 RepID=A0AC59ZN24_RANTA|nr:unnamed protein product [Rangifer tarandus platyrhynchus]